MGRYSYATTRVTPSVRLSFRVLSTLAGFSAYRSLKLAPTSTASSACSTNRPDSWPSLVDATLPSAAGRHPEPARCMSASRNCR